MFTKNTVELAKALKNSKDFFAANFRAQNAVELGNAVSGKYNDMLFMAALARADRVFLHLRAPDVMSLGYCEINRLTNLVYVAAGPDAVTYFSEKSTGNPGDELRLTVIAVTVF